MLGAAHVVFACAARFVIDLTAHRLAALGTKAALSIACLRWHRALRADNTIETERPPCDRPPPARCSRRNAFALQPRARREARRLCCVFPMERRACRQAPICRNGSAARRSRWRLIDSPGARHGSAFTPDRQVRRCRNGRGRRRRSICKHSKTGRRQISHACARAAVGTLAGATLLFLQARLNRQKQQARKRHRRFRTQG